MTDVRITTAGDVLAIPADFDLASWNIGRSGDLGGGVEVWTTWLPVSGYYETLVILPDGLRERFFTRFPNDHAITHTHIDALETHRAWVQALQQWLNQEETR